MGAGQLISHPSRGSRAASPPECVHTPMATMERQMQIALDVHADEHAGAMNMYTMSSGAFLRREGPESEPATAYRDPKVPRWP